MDSNVRAKFKAELPGLYDRLLAQAVEIVRRSGWRGRFDMNRKSVAEDVLHEAIHRAMFGKRRWDPTKVDLWGFLVGVMKSIVYNSANSPANNMASFDEPVRDGATKTKWDSVESDAEEADEVLIRDEQAKAMEEQILAAAGDDPVLLKYVEAMMDGAESPADIAAKTGMAVKDVYQAHRKLCRRIEAQKAKEVA